jgi:hypothetical protein
MVDKEGVGAVKRVAGTKYGGGVSFFISGLIKVFSAS